MQSMEERIETGPFPDIPKQLATPPPTSMLYKFERMKNGSAVVVEIPATNDTQSCNVLRSGKTGEEVLQTTETSTEKSENVTETALNDQTTLTTSAMEEATLTGAEVTNFTAGTDAQNKKSAQINKATTLHTNLTSFEQQQKENIGNDEKEVANDDKVMKLLSRL